MTNNLPFLGHRILFSDGVASLLSTPAQGMSLPGILDRGPTYILTSSPSRIMRMKEVNGNTPYCFVVHSRSLHHARHSFGTAIIKSKVYSCRTHYTGENNSLHEAVLHIHVCRSALKCCARHSRVIFCAWKLPRCP